VEDYHLSPELQAPELLDRSQWRQAQQLMDEAGMLCFLLVRQQVD
jgi:hypothetical protein